MGVQNGQCQRIVSIRIHRVDVGLGVQQRLHGIDFALTRGKQQRGQAAARDGRSRSARRHLGQAGVAIIGADIEFRAVRGQHADDIRMALGGRPHQRRLPAEIFFGVHIGVMRQQHLHRFHVAFARCFHQHGLGLGGGKRIRVRASLEQLLDQRAAADTHRFGQRRGSITVQRGRVGACGSSASTVSRSPQCAAQCSAVVPSASRSVYIDVLFQQSPNSFRVLILDGVHQRGIAIGGG